MATTSPDPERKKTLLVGMGLGALLVLVLLAAVGLGYWLGQQKPVAPAAPSRSAVPARPAPAALQPLNVPAAAPAQPPVAAPLTPALPPTPVPATPMAAPAAEPVAQGLPTDAATAQEELDRHRDDQARLQQQKQLLQAQLQGSRQIIDLKARQIAALEQQLASTPESQ